MDNTERNLSIWFELFGDCDNIQELNERLGIQATIIKNKKDHLMPNLPDEWIYKMSFGNVFELEDGYNVFLDLFENKSKLIREMQIEYGLEARVEFIISYDYEHNMGKYFSKRFINFLYDSNMETEIFIYCSKIENDEEEI